MKKKQCTKCQKFLRFSEFYHDNHSRDGLSYWCNDCRKENVRQHRLDPEYRKKQMIWNNKWRNRPENRQKVLKMRRKSQNKINDILCSIGRVTPILRKNILSRDSYQCLSCQSRQQLTIDHIIPISKGGLTQEENLQTLCRSCNAKKQRQIIDFRNSQQ